MSWKRPLWFWVLFYFLWSIGGAFTLCAYALALMAKDGDYGGPGGFVIAMVLMAVMGAVGGAVVCALFQFGRWLYETLTSNPKDLP